jgi:hypothetical protein
MFAIALIRTGVLSWLVRLKVRSCWVPVPLAALVWVLQLPFDSDPGAQAVVEFLSSVLLVVGFGIADDLRSEAREAKRLAKRRRGEF